jgi:hypothetical protein
LIQDSWTQLSAEAREHYQFRISVDPRAQYEITEGKVEAHGLVGIISYYKFDAEKLPCCLCGVARHNGGAVVHISDQTLRLVGNCCGKSHFKDDWSASTNAIAKAERDANYRKKAKQLFEDEYDVMSAAKFLRRYGQEAETARSELKKLFSFEYKRLADELFRSAGRLSYEIAISDDFRDQGTRGALKSTLADTDPISGWEMFTHHSWETRVENLVGKTDEAFKTLRNAYDKNLALSGPLKKTNDCIDSLLQLYATLGDIVRYNETKNCEIIDFWFGQKAIAVTVSATQNLWQLNGSVSSRSSALPTLKRPPIPSTL